MSGGNAPFHPKFPKKFIDIFSLAGQWGQLRPALNKNKHKKYGLYTLL